MKRSIVDILSCELSTRSHKLWAEIDLGALVGNYKRICELSGTDVIPVIKADAYGHGAAEAMLALVEAGARFFAVSSIAEAVELRLFLEDRNISDKIDIIILGYTPEDDADLLSKYDIIQTVFSLSYAQGLSRALPSGAKVRVHIKLDTGMNRIGFDTTGGVSDIALAASLDNLVCEGIFTHFACADEHDSGLTSLQLGRFEKTVKELEDKGITFKVRHICNSAGIMREDVSKYDAVRAGIILYGMPPSDEFDMTGFETVMSLKARIAHVHTLKKGESVSYGATFTAEKDMQIATIPAGYGDGFIRAYKESTVRVNDRECPIVGRICMDQFMIDVTDANAHPGDVAVLFDDRDKINKLAKLSNTISYETLCLIGKRVPRVYIKK